MSPLGMVLGNLNPPPLSMNASPQNPSRDKWNPASIQKHNHRDQQIRPQREHTTRSPSHPPIPVHFLTRLKVSQLQQNHRKLNHQLVSKENKM